MTFTKFWQLIKKTGKSPEGDHFSLVDEDRMHILSPGNKNQQFYVSREAAEKWYDLLSGGMSPKEFRKNYSAYFCNVFYYLAINYFGWKPIVYLCQNHKNAIALTIKDECGSRWNLAWICRGHGCLNFKLPNVPNVNRYLIGEIALAGGDVIQHADYVEAIGGATCHNGGVGYQGYIRLGSVEAAVRYLKQYFTVVACPGNATATQLWIDNI